MKHKKKKKKKYRLFWFFVKLQFLLMILAVAGIGYYYYGGYAVQIQNMKEEAVQFARRSTPADFRAAQTSVVYDKDRNTISTLKGEKDVYYLTYEQIPIDACAAIVSIEDKKFYQHNGIDYKAIIRAVKAMLENGEVTQGGSTITQQLARNIFLTMDRTWQRKVEEMFLATELEKKYSKTEILEYYLNNIYFGNGYYGIQAASFGYFNVEVSALDLSQIAFLCAIPNNPTLYDPLTNMENTLGRRDRILENMYEDGKITESAYLMAKAEEITLSRPEYAKNNYVETYTYYCAIRLLMEQEGFAFQTEFKSEEDREAYTAAYNDLYAETQKRLYTAGYRIYTSIDLNMQAMLQQAIDEKLGSFTDVNEEGVYKLQGAGVCIDNDTGYVRAIVGGRSQDFAGYTLNRAYQSYRQPGSSIKPLIVYTPALERGYTPDSTVTDQYIEDGPSNADGYYAGDMTLRNALSRSKNTVAWQLFEELSPQVGLSYLKAMNFSRISSEDERLTSSLGGLTNGVSPVELTSAYAALENDGKYRPPTCIVKITDSEGVEIVSAAQEEKEVYKTTASRMMTDMLMTAITEGTGSGLGVTNMPSAGKTGTTNDNKDGWFAGYTRYYTTSIWVGYDMPAELPGLSGSSYPGQIWHTFMENCHAGLSPAEFLPYVEMDLYQKIRRDALGTEDVTMDQENNPEQNEQGENE
ncbi:MAG: PBP1A family penicillin-binding protein [Lachnospiraceae bacterium]|nr:PBP1A family penicillin-binding protein [Lachnospiraceae bacterium]